MTFSKVTITAALISASSMALAICPNYTGMKIGQLDRNTISEASGVSASHLQPGKILWSNDSGNSGTIYASTMDGKIGRTVKLENFRNVDMEALAIGPCPSNRADKCIFVGDIGDYIGGRSDFKIGIFKEKDFWASTSISPEKTLTYQASRINAEAMVVLPNGQVLIFTKHESGITQLLVIDSVTGKTSAHAQFDLNPVIKGARGKGPRITDASLSPEGDRILLLTYGDILEVSLKALEMKVAPSQWKKGVDYTLVAGPQLPQQETIAYVNSKEFIVSTESPDGDVPPVIGYSCK